MKKVDAVKWRDNLKIQLEREHLQPANLLGTREKVLSGNKPETSEDAKASFCFKQRIPFMCDDGPGLCCEHTHPGI